ncbi:metallophosphoesterase [Candidatus Microgenomates bacterium]|nr:metallophosphoesterase [Candidatus Microgenomates bacterium]
MRYLIFSDSHLTHHFDASKYAVLKEAISHADRVIINGDFWDGFSTTFEQFVQSPWKDNLFPLLKKKKTVYIYGNHDAAAYSDKRASLFSEKQATTYAFDSGDITIHCEHGNRLVPLIDEWLHTRMPPAANKIYSTFEDAMVKVFAHSYLRLAYAKFNKIAKEKIRSEGHTNYVAIGHTHFAEHDAANRFLNSGIIQHGLAQYIYIEDGTITPVEKKY